MAKRVSLYENVLQQSKPTCMRELHEAFKIALQNWCADVRSASMEHMECYKDTLNLLIQIEGWLEQTGD